MRAPVHALLPLVAVVGCQSIADLTVPTYEDEAGVDGGTADAADDATNASEDASSSEAEASSEGGACSAKPMGGGGACTFSDPSLPPCPEHVQLWLNADCGVALDGDGAVGTWQDSSGFGWTATPLGGSVTIVDAMNGHHAVHLDNAGMTLDPHGKALHLPAFGVFGAYRFSTFFSGGASDPTHPYGAQGILELATGSTSPTLEVELINQSFNVVPNDGQTSLWLSNNDVLQPGAWHVCSAQYNCDGTCFTNKTMPAGEDFVDGYQGGFRQTPTNSPSLDESSFYTGWTGAWDASLLGAQWVAGGTTQVTSKMVGDIGELLLYDTYLDMNTRDLVRQYLLARWL